MGYIMKSRITNCLWRLSAIWKGKGGPYSTAERRVPEIIPVLGSQPTGDVSHKPGGRLPLLSARPAVAPATLKRAATNFAAWWTEALWVWTVCLRLIPDSVDYDLNPGPSAPESSTLTTRLPSHPMKTGRLSIPDAWLVLTRTKWGRTNLESGRYANYSNISTTLDTGRFRGLKGKTPLMLTEVMSWVQRIIMRYSDDTAYIFSLFFIYRQFFLRII